MPKIEIPENLRDHVLVVSLSGGKDSVATALALREAGIEHRAVFADTKWESGHTYEYLDYLESEAGFAIDRVETPGGMIGQIEHQARLPGRMQRWCTRELKIEPLRAYHDALVDAGEDTVAVLGIRHEEGTESNGRGEALEVEWDDLWDGWIWRPLIEWTIADVIAIHYRHGVKLNPLYEMGLDRVGCWPCIYATKEEIRLMAQLDPGRIDELERLEAAASALRRARNLETPGRYSDEEATFFQTRRKGFSGIRAVVDWARTERGGRQLPLFDPPPRGGCMRWGLCETGVGVGSPIERRSASGARGGT